MWFLFIIILQSLQIGVFSMFTYTIICRLEKEGIYKDIKNDELYMLGNSILHRIPSWHVFESHNFSENEIMFADTTVRVTKTVGFTNLFPWSRSRGYFSTKNGKILSERPSIVQCFVKLATFKPILSRIQGIYIILVLV